MVKSDFSFLIKEENIAIMKFKHFEFLTELSVKKIRNSYLSYIQ